MAGLLATAGPAGAQGGGADFTRSAAKASLLEILDYEGTPVLDDDAATDAVGWGGDRSRAFLPFDVYAEVGAITYNGHPGLGWMWSDMSGVR